MKLTHRIAVAAGALTLGATGIAAAADPPDAADDGLTKASEQVGVELPASQDAHPPATEAEDDDELDDDAIEDEGDAEESDDAEAEGVGPQGNHGAEVSAVAQVNDPETGNEHGIAVSEVARQGHGQGPSAEHGTGHGRP